MSDLTLNPANKTEPRVLMLIGAAGVGKTTALAGLPVEQRYVVPCDPGGWEYYEHYGQRPESLPELEKQMAALPGDRFTFGILDTLDWVEMAVEREATRQTQQIRALAGEMAGLPSCLDRPKGAGYRSFNDLMVQTIAKLMAKFPRLILVCHLKNPETPGVVAANDIALIGKNRTLVLGMASMCGLCLRNKDGDFVVSFRYVQGSAMKGRCPWLADQDIVLGSPSKGWDWSPIYPSLKP